jgi:2-polyprenyl-3-methyl-5-hydroxy-6-metoxy-1,4-benzoquinol methylase
MERVACNLCAADDAAKVYSKFGLGISRCRRCGLVYAGPERLSPEESRSRYNATYFESEYLPSLGVQDGEFDLAFFDDRHRQILGWLAPARRLGTLLEVGCGAGFFLKSAERAGWQVTGLEVMDEGVRFAGEKLGLDVRQGVIEQCGLPVGGFDAVVMLDVVEHLSDPACTLGAARDLLRDAGVLLLFTPNYGALSRLGLGGTWAVLSPQEHLYYFTETTLCRVLEKAGFSRVSFLRRRAVGSVYDTLNPFATHEPERWRSRMWRRMVDRLGPAAGPAIQRLGWADALLCVATR